MPAYRNAGRQWREQPVGLSPVIYPGPGEGTGHAHWAPACGRDCPYSLLLPLLCLHTRALSRKTGATVLQGKTSASCGSSPPHLSRVELSVSFTSSTNSPGHLHLADAGVTSTWSLTVNNSGWWQRVIIQSDKCQAELSSGCVVGKVSGGFLEAGRLQLSFAGRGRGGQGAWVLV